MSITLRIIWRTQKDSDVCPTCKALDGYTWVVEAGKPIPKQLVHPEFGPVFDNRPAVEGSLVKEETGHICRCTLVHQFDVSNVLKIAGREPEATVDEVVCEESV